MKFLILVSVHPLIKYLAYSFFSKRTEAEVIQHLKSPQSPCHPQGGLRKKEGGKKIAIYAWTLAVSILLLASCASKNEPVSAIKAPLKVEQKPQAKTIFSELSCLIRNNYNQPEKVKLQLVNDFFNERIQWLSDPEIWHKEDYWATPRETMRKNAGDCEDFCIAKYYTLISMGIPTEKLKMTYVKDIELNQAHMVLTYYLYKGSEPLVLDNKNKKIIKSSRRSDLIHVYSFNHHGTWIAKQNKLGQRVGSSRRNRLWAEVSMRMAREYE